MRTQHQAKSAMYLLVTARKGISPAFMQRETTLADGTKRWVSFGFAEGPERVTAFWGKEGRFFAQYCNEVGRD